MRIEHSTAADGGCRRALPENEMVAGDKNNRLMQSQSHEPMSAWLDRIGAVKRNGCKRVCGKRVEVNRGTMLQSFRSGQQGCLNVNRRYGCQRSWLDDGLATGNVGYINAGKIQSHARPRVNSLFGSAMSLHASN